MKSVCNYGVKRGKILALSAIMVLMGTWTFSTISFGVETDKSAVEKGYSSSYLPTKQGPLVNIPIASPDHPVLNLDTSHMSVAEKFDLSREGMLKSDFKLFSFYKDIGYDEKAEHWEGKCHQWSAGANDKNIKPLINASKGVLCQGIDGKGIVLYDVDLKELITATYPSKTMEIPNSGGQLAFFGGRQNKNQNQEKPVNDIDQEMKDSMGVTDFSPFLFHEKIHHYLKAGQGVVLDVDPREEVWNQPVYSADSEVTEENEMPIFPPHLYEATSPTAQDHLTTINEIHSVFNALLNKSNKKEQDKVSDIMAQNLSGSSISPALMEQIKELEKANPSLVSVVEGLLSRKKEAFEAAKAQGLKIKDGYKVKKVATKVEYLMETHYRGLGTEFTARTYSYHVVENNTGDMVYSQWIGPSLPGRRPDFMWVPSCQSETCDAEASIYRGFFNNMSPEDKVKYENFGLTIGLSDLLNLMKGCFPLDKALDAADRLVKNTNKAKAPWEMGEEGQKEVAADYKTLIEGKLPVKKESFKKLLSMPGITLDSQNNLSMVDWNPNTTDCQEIKNGVTTKLPKSRCMGDPKDGKFEKWGLLNKECWESTGILLRKKWLRKVPPSLCGINEDDGGISIGPIRLPSTGRLPIPPIGLGRFF